MNTPIEELIYYLKTQGFYLMDSERKKYLEKERQFIIDAYNEGDKNCMNELGSSIKGVDIVTKSAEQYYNETFKK
jgi:hypothetical protein